MLKLHSSIYSPQYFRAFENIEVVPTIKQADAVLFVGGEDVTPSLYGEQRHPETHCNPARDEVEIHAYYEAKTYGKPCIGICRGSQFLWVMMGGKLDQHVEGHIGPHIAIDKKTGHLFPVTSTHHQAVKGNLKDVEVLAISEEDSLTEAYWSEKHKNLAVQFHPEYYLNGTPPQDTRMYELFNQWVSRFIQEN